MSGVSDFCRTSQIFQMLNMVRILMSSTEELSELRAFWCARDGHDGRECHVRYLKLLIHSSPFSAACNAAVSSRKEFWCPKWGSARARVAGCMCKEHLYLTSQVSDLSHFRRACRLIEQQLG